LATSLLLLLVPAMSLLAVIGLRNVIASSDPALPMALADLHPNTYRMVRWHRATRHALAGFFKHFSPF